MSWGIYDFLPFVQKNIWQRKNQNGGIVNKNRPPGLRIFFSLLQ